MNPRDSMEVMDSVGPTVESLGDANSQEKEMEGMDDKTPGAYDCNICGRSFPFLSSLSQHMRRHTGARPYKCPYCDHRASQKGNLKVHIRSHKLGTLSSYHSNDDEEVGADEEEEETSSAEVSVSEGLDGGTSPTKSSSACNRVVSGDSAEEGRRKIPARSVKREKPTASGQRPFCCRLCGYEAQREDQLLSHIEKVHITADKEEDDPPSLKEDTGSEGDTPVQPSDDGTFPCETCGQVFTQAWFLKSHMKKHAGILEHCCRVCGRRFREAWFLKSHMKTHNTKSKSRPKAEFTDPPATINDVAQDPEAGGGAVTSVYQICCKCGNLFHSRESLRAHEKVHNPGHGKKSQRRASDDEDSPAAKRCLLDYLNLRAVEEKEQHTPEEEMVVAEEEEEEEVEEKNWLGQRIQELDPVCSYQAWQLATKGRVVEPMEPSRKGSSRGGSMGEDGLAGAAVVYEKESSRYVLQGQERRNTARRNRTSSGDQTPESHSDSEYRPSSRQDRRRPSSTSSSHTQASSSSKANECFECGKVFRSRHQLSVHLRVHRRDGGKAPGGEKDRNTRDERWGSTSDPESGSPSRPGTPGYGDSPPPASTLGDQASEMGMANAGALTDEKPYICSLCDFTTTESQIYLTHVRVQHPINNNNNNNNDLPSSAPGAAGPGPANRSTSKLKSPLLLHTPPHPYLSAPPARDRRPAELSPVDPGPAPLDLCVRPEGHRGPASVPEGGGLPRHKCSFCSHSTSYPEVLWMHQTVAHRITSGSSTLAPKWALRPTTTLGTSGESSSSSSSSSGRRTGPPPVLEGKECPPLPSETRNPRTRPPTHCNEPAKKSRPAGHPTASPSPAASSSSSSGRPSSASGRPPPAQGRTHGRPVASSGGGGSGGGSSGGSGGGSSGGGGGRRSVEQEHTAAASRSRPKVDMYPQGATSSSSSGSLEKSTGAPQRPPAPAQAPSPGSTAGGSRLADRYLMPQEGLGFMLSSKHGLAPEYGRARATPQPHKASSLLHHHPNTPNHHNHPHHHTQQAHANSAHSQGHANASRPSAISHSSLVGRGYGSTASSPHTHGGALQNSGVGASLSSGVRGEMKQEAPAETPEMPVDILGFLKNYSPHELAALYQRWGAANAMMDPSGMLRALMRQGSYACHECGKSFSQPSHLRTHMRSHTVGFDFNGLHRGADPHATTADAEAPPKQARDRSAASSARTEPLRKGT
ncbi:zinc finger protein 516-like isoform X2 [Gadus chalcogrammus]|uniref:zinc finger protein 516-like isoform X2 n=1 Tax=Gadus chalcogrammus TaxID=1042646 RepID=UPI0024C482B1|nr:zinc finger protein 516-like isoform X2 [Gadus chalcogrammus]